MPTTPAIKATVNITAKDLNGNNIAKQFNNVVDLRFNYFKGVVEVTDITGQFYFSLLLITTLTYTITTGIGGVTTVVMS